MLVPGVVERQMAAIGRRLRLINDVKSLTIGQEFIQSRNERFTSSRLRDSEDHLDNNYTVTLKDSE